MWNAEHFLQTEIFKILFQNCQHSQCSKGIWICRSLRLASHFIHCNWVSLCWSLWSITFIAFRMIVKCCIERELSPTFYLPEGNKKNQEKLLSGVMGKLRGSCWFSLLRAAVHRWLLTAAQVERTRYRLHRALCPCRSNTPSPVFLKMREKTFGLLT